MLKDAQVVRGALREFVAAQSDIGDAMQVSDDADLFATGLMDSFVAVSLLAFCEERFGTALDLVDLGPENFQSLNALTALVLRHPEQASAGS